MTENVKRLKLRERRSGNPRIVWIAPPSPGYTHHEAGHIDRRIDKDGIAASLELARMLRRAEARGLLFAILRSDGRFEMGYSGALYDNPLIAGGLAAKLIAMTDSWHDHPSIYLPDSI